MQRELCRRRELCRGSCVEAVVQRELCRDSCTEGAVQSYSCAKSTRERETYGSCDNKSIYLCVAIRIYYHIK